MSLKYRKITTSITLLVSLAIAQFFVGAGRAETNVGLRVSEATPQLLFGILTTTDGKPITVNGASAVTGATIPTGALIETPDKIGATIRLDRQTSMCSICIAPNTKLTLEFTRQGEAGSVKINLIEGYVILHTRQGTAGMITSAQGILGQLDAATDGRLDIGLRPGSAPRINQGAAADAGAGASAVDCGTQGAAAVLTAFPWWQTIGLGGLITASLIPWGGNPSPSAP